MPENSGIYFIHIVLLAGLVWLVGKRSAMPHTVRAGGVLKLASGLFLGWLYQNQWGGGDTWAYHAEAVRLWDLLCESPLEYLKVFIGHIPEGDWAFAREPRALFFSALISLPVGFTQGEYYLASAWISLLTWVGILLGIRGLRQSNVSVAPWMVALLFWPGVVFWSSGILKETLMIGLLGVVLSQLPMMVGVKPIRWWRLVVLFIVFWLLWQLKYYVAGVTFAAIGALWVGQSLNRSPRPRLAWFAFWGTWAVLLLVATLTYPKLYLSVLLQSLHDNYLIFHTLSSPPQTVVYPYWDGTLPGALFTTPQVMMLGLFWPLPGFHWHEMSLLAGIENLILAVLSLLAIINLWKQSRSRKLKVDMLQMTGLMYFLILLVMIGLATPNLGTWARYKVLYLPLLLSWVFRWANLGKWSRSIFQPSN